MGKANHKLAVVWGLTGTSWGLHTKDLIAIYKTYIRPVLEYAAPVWHSTLDNHSENLLHSFQGRALRYIHALPRQASQEALEIEANIEPLDDRRHTALLMEYECVLCFPDHHCLKRHISDHLQQPLRKHRRLQHTNFM